MVKMNSMSVYNNKSVIAFSRSGSDQRKKPDISLNTRGRREQAYQKFEKEHLATISVIVIASSSVS